MIRVVKLYDLEISGNHFGAENCLCRHFLPYVFVCVELELLLQEVSRLEELQIEVGYFFVQGLEKPKWHNRAILV